jgi:hypothetical protein
MLEELFEKFKSQIVEGVLRCLSQASNKCEESAQEAKTSWPPKDAGHLRSKPEPAGETFDPSQKTLQDEEYLTTPDRLQVLWKK